MDPDEAFKLCSVASLPRKIKTQYKRAVQRGRRVACRGAALLGPSQQGASMAPLSREPPPLPPSRPGPWGGGHPPLLSGPALPLERSRGLPFCHTEVKCRWHPRSASPGLKRSLFGKGIFSAKRRRQAPQDE